MKFALKRPERFVVAGSLSGALDAARPPASPAPARTEPPTPFHPGMLEEIERHAVAWRWRLRGRTHRLRQVHGDFHPWYILFGTGTRFTLLDRSRGEWGEPADDVVSLTMNYALFALAGTGRFEGGLRSLFLRFWSRYLEAAGDTEMLEVAPPVVAFRCLVLSSPEWFPALGDVARRRLLRLALRVLDRGAFEPEQDGSELA